MPEAEQLDRREWGRSDPKWQIRGWHLPLVLLVLRHQRLQHLPLVRWTGRHHPLEHLLLVRRIGRHHPLELMPLVRWID